MVHVTREQIVAVLEFAARSLDAPPSVNAPAQHSDPRVRQPEGPAEIALRQNLVTAKVRDDQCRIVLTYKNLKRHRLGVIARR